MCQDLVEEEENEEVNAPAIQSQTVHLISCSPGETAQAETFIPELCTRLDEANKEESVHLYKVFEKTIENIKKRNVQNHAVITYDSNQESINIAEILHEKLRELRFASSKYLLTDKILDGISTAVQDDKDICKKVMIIGVRTENRAIPGPTQKSTPYEITAIVDFLEKSWASLPWIRWQVRNLVKQSQGASDTS